MVLTTVSSAATSVALPSGGSVIAGTPAMPKSAPAKVQQHADRPERVHDLSGLGLGVLLRALQRGYQIAVAALLSCLQLQGERLQDVDQRLHLAQEALQHLENQTQQVEHEGNDRRPELESAGRARAPTAASPNSSSAATGGTGRPLIMSISGFSSFRTFSRHWMLARNGAICSIRLKVMEQSVGMPLEISAKACKEPPVGSCTDSPPARGSVMSGTGAATEIIAPDQRPPRCRCWPWLTSFLELNWVSVGRNDSPIQRDVGASQFEDTLTADGDFSVRHGDGVAVRILDDQRAQTAARGRGVEEADAMAIHRRDAAVANILARRCVHSVPQKSHDIGRSRVALVEPDQDLVLALRA